MTIDTKERLLDAAEKLFSEHGVPTTSLRAITRAAKANLAAVNYHFGSKEALVQSVLDRRLRPLNAERIHRLDELETAHPEGPSVEAILDALLAPAFVISASSHHDFVALVTRLHFAQDPALVDLLLRNFDEVQERFFAALNRALPELGPRQLMYRFHFAIGAMAMALINRDVLPRASRGLIEAVDDDNLLQRLVNFLAHGFRAPQALAEVDGESAR